MKKPFKTLCLLSILCILSSSNVSAKDYYPLRLLTEHSPPSAFLDKNGEPAGVTVELIHILQQRLDEPGKIKVLPWARAMKIARTESGIALFETVRTEERENWFKWVGPLQSYHVSLYGLKQQVADKPDINTSPDDYIACSYRNSAIVNEVKKFGFKVGHNLILTSKMGDCQQMVLLGRADVTPVSELMLTEFIAAAEQAGDQLIPVAFLTERQRYLAFSKDVDDKRVTRWQSALEQSYLDGTMRKLYQTAYPELIIRRLERFAKDSHNKFD
ncbi:substrate-binding periplasmic protein [Neptunicella sp. SCSIO 80796]|uniref:substrate-binding periplasmic protein n=1 Tax=Neptunicella plasticusilytica TaxID=3117012 RepID=UPI003A4E3F77